MRYTIAMEQKEIERLLLENLKMSRENREYIIKIDRRQRWTRNFTIFYWTVLIALAVTGYYFAFPYLQVIRDQVTTVSSQFGNLFNITAPLGY